MIAANIKLGYSSHYLEGETPKDIITSLSEFQDFDCLVSMARVNETKKYQKEVDKLEAFVNKYNQGSLTLDDIRMLDVRLSIADIVCKGVAEGDEEIAKLKANN